jgi:hypothetical protein
MSAYMQKELLLFLRAAGMGAFFLFLYEGLCALRVVVPHRKILVSLEDLFFWLLCALLLFALIYRENSGVFRSFLPEGALFGAGCMWIAAHRKLSVMWIKLWRILVYPVNFLINGLLFWIKRCRISVYRFMKRCQSWGVKPFHRWIKRGKQIGKFKEGAEQKANRE